MSVDSRNILLKLVRMAMGWEDDYSLPNEINWAELLKLANEQGVGAIALDGYTLFLKQNPGIVSIFSKPDNENLAVDAFSIIGSYESSNKLMIKALKSLSSILFGKGIPFLLMKGLSCGRYYPIPEHRACGDIDIYPGTRFDDSNKALAEAGISSDLYYYRHSASYIHNVMIENHRVLCDLRGPKNQVKKFEALLEETAAKSLALGKEIKISGECIHGAIVPSADFNVLFLPWHVSAHFAYERVTLRHLLDWALFLINDGKDISLEQFQKAKKKFTYGFSAFADILTNLAIRYLKIPVDNIPQQIVDDAENFDNNLADRVFDYMFNGKLRQRDSRVWKFRLNNVKRIWQERWKYRNLYGMSAIHFLYYKTLGVFNKTGE